MIKHDQSLFILETDHTTYAFHVLPSGHLEHLWYGERLDLKRNWQALCEPHTDIGGYTIAYSQETPGLALEDTCLEYSSLGKGDLGDPLVELRFADGSATCDFLFREAVIRPYRPLEGLPSAAGPLEELVVTLEDNCRGVLLELSYVPVPGSDCILRSARLINEQEEPLTLTRLLSCQLDLPRGDHTFTSFHGAWVREMERRDIPCGPGRYVNEGRTGTSSNRANPLVMLAEAGCGEEAGRCWGENLIYSGEHYESVEQNGFGRLRFLAGIQPAGFSWQLEPGASFQAPQSVLSFSHQGYGVLSQHLHHFVRHHIVRGPWQWKPRPVLVNSWESVYFRYDENQLLELARDAKNLGAELFVLDDGWFGRRDSDTTSLGDWTAHPEKFPGGIASFCGKIAGLGLQMGIWVEPEMVSEDSDCYRSHPDWAVTSPGRPHSQGRSQMILDFTRKEVRQHILNQMRALFRSGPITYVKWDMNRSFSDRFSQSLSPDRQGEFLHRYVLGLYQVLDTLTGEFPHILFESCAGGGNRSDLGMLCYMPQMWATDNTDALCRSAIQQGYSYSYPPSVIGAHVSACPNHQTGRTVSLKTRFHEAAFGLMGYECDLRELTGEEGETIARQIALYKAHRQLLQFGSFHRVRHSERGIQWAVVSPDGETALALDMCYLTVPNAKPGKLMVSGLKDGVVYRVTEVYPDGTEGEPLTASGRLLRLAGFHLPPVNRPGLCAPPVPPDFSSRLFLLRKEK